MRLAALTVAIVLLPACGTNSAAGFDASSQAVPSCAAIFTALGLSPSQIADAGHRDLCQPQALTFNGELSGSVKTAYLRDNGQPCQTPRYGDSWSLPALYFVLGGRAYLLSLAPPDVYRDQASLTHDLGSTSVEQVTGGAWDWQGRSGSLAVGDDGVSGTIHASFGRDAADASTLQVKGKWSCGVAAPTATAAASTPCGQYYLDAGLDDDQIRDLRSHCLPQRLELNGTLHFSVASAINDSEHPGNTFGDPPSNLCGVVGKSYYATLAFSHRRDTFEIALAVRSTSPLSDPVFEPETFPLSNGLYASPDVFAQMYVADASADGPKPAGGVAAYQWNGDAGSYSVNPDLHSGTADLWLSGGNQLEDRIHLSGQWRCA